MKETKIQTLTIEELINEGVYMTHTKDLVKIKEIDKDKNYLYLYNISECCNVYMTLNKHSIIKRIR